MSNHIKRILKFFSMCYFLIIGVLFNVLHRNKKYIEKDLIIKTDHLGDYIIWQEIHNVNTILVSRNLTGIKSNIALDIYKLYRNPIYLIKTLKRVSAHYNRVIVPSSSKTPEMLLLKLVCFSKNKSITLKDDNGNVDCISFFEKLLFNEVLINSHNEYQNVKILKKYLINSKILKKNWLSTLLSIKSDLVVFMPFSSGEYKQITLDQYIQICNVLEFNAIKTIVIGRVSTIEKDKYEKVIHNFKYIHSNINNIELEEYSILVKNNKTVYFGMDTSMFHYFYKNDLASAYLLIMGLGYGFRFIPNDDRILSIYKECKDSNCNWICKYSKTECIHNIEF